MPIPGHHWPARRAFGGIHTPTMKQSTSMWLFPHQQAEKSLQNQHVLSILQVGSHQLQYRFFRTKKPKSHHKTNTFCPITPITRKVGIEVGGSQLEGWTKRVGFVATFWLAGAGKSTLKLVVSSWGYEYPQMSGVRASDDQVWALSVRGAAMALLPVQYQPGQPH